MQIPDLSFNHKGRNLGALVDTGNSVDASRMNFSSTKLVGKDFGMSDDPGLELAKFNQKSRGGVGAESFESEDKQEF